MDVAGIRETFIIMSALMSLCSEKEFGLKLNGAQKHAAKLILKWLYEYRQVNIFKTRVEILFGCLRQWVLILFVLFSGYLL